MLRAPPGPLVCDVGGLQDPDAAALDVLAHLQLIAKRCGRALRIENASGELAALLAFAGLDGVIRCSRIGVEARGEPEEREETIGIQEERDARDPPV